MHTDLFIRLKLMGSSATKSFAKQCNDTINPNMIEVLDSVKCNSKRTFQEYKEVKRTLRNIMKGCCGESPTDQAVVDAGASAGRGRSLGGAAGGHIIRYGGLQDAGNAVVTDNTHKLAVVMDDNFSVVPGGGNGADGMRFKCSTCPSQFARIDGLQRHQDKLLLYGKHNPCNASLKGTIGNKPLIG